MKIDYNISRFCELVVEINKQNAELKKSSREFYSGGNSFEEVYEDDIKEIVGLQEELKIILKEIII